MSGTTAYVAYLSKLPNFSGETIKQFPVKGLLLNLMEKARRLARESIVIWRIDWLVLSIM